MSRAGPLFLFIATAIAIAAPLVSGQQLGQREVDFAKELGRPTKSSRYVRAVENTWNITRGRIFELPIQGKKRFTVTFVDGVAQHIAIVSKGSLGRPDALFVTVNYLLPEGVKFEASEATAQAFSGMWVYPFNSGYYVEIRSLDGRTVLLMGSAAFTNGGRDVYRREVWQDYRKNRKFRE